MEKNIVQPFNYNTRIYRYSYSTEETLEEYILSARKNGLSSIGFTFLSPKNIYEYQDFKKEEMNISEVGDNIRTIVELKEKYTDIDILVGFKAKYSIQDEELLCSLKDEVDYLLLGQDEIRNAKIDGDYPIVYADTICKAMETGLFDIVAHPDKFLEYKNNLQGEELNKFEKNTVEAMRMICSKSKELNIPLEINVRGYLKKRSYPSIDFFKMCSYIGCPVLFGSDARSKEEIELFQNNINDCIEYLSVDNLKFVLNSYKPGDNDKLKELYKEFKPKVRTYKYYKAKETLNNIMSTIENNNYLKELEDKVISMISVSDNERKEFINTLSKTYDINIASPLLITRLQEIIIPGASNTRDALKEFYTELAEIIEENQEFSRVEKSKFVELITNIMEYRSTKNSNTKNLLEKEISDIKTYYGEEILGGNEKGSKLVKINGHYRANEIDNNDEFNGFTNIAIVALILSFIIGFGIGIAYMIITLK